MLNFRPLGVTTKLKVRTDELEVTAGAQQVAYSAKFALQGEDLSLFPRTYVKMLDMVCILAYVCNPSTGEAEIGGSQSSEASQSG